MGDILSLVFFFMVSALATPGILSLQHSSFEAIRASSAAGQMTEIAAAANQYVQDNYNTLVANAGTTTVTIAQLQALHYLSAGVLPENPYGQQWEVEVDQPTPGKLQAVVLSVGGNQIPAMDAAYAAAQTKGIGGFVPYPNQVSGASSSEAVGAYGGWKISMAGYTNDGPGHLVGLLSYSQNGQLNNDYLYRNAISGQPQLNTMNTDIDMAGNSVQHATTLGFSNGSATNTVAQLTSDPTNKITLSSPNGDGSLNIQGRLGVMGEDAQSGYPAAWAGIHTWDLYANGSIGSGTNGSLLADLSGQLGAGGLVQTVSPNGAVEANIESDNNQAHVTVGNNAGAYATINVPDNGSNNDASIATNGAVSVNNPNNGSPSFYAYNNGYAGVTDTFTVGARLQLGTAFGQANQGAGCSPNGEIAANANGTGQLMACVNGTWQTPGASAGLTQAFNAGCSGSGGSVSWTNPYPTPAEAFFTNNGTEGNGSIIANVYNKYGQEYQALDSFDLPNGTTRTQNSTVMVPGNGAIVVYPADYYYRAVSGVCLYGFDN